MRAVDVEQRAGIAIDILGAAHEAAGADGQRRAPLSGQFARRLRDHVDHAAHGVGAPHGRGRTANHLDLLDLVGVGGHEVPHHHAVEVEVDGAAVHERQLRRGQGGGGAAGRDVEVARRYLADVEPWHRSQEVADVRRRRVFDRLRGYHAHGGWRVDQLLLDTRGRHDDGLLEGWRLLGILRLLTRRRRLCGRCLALGHDRSCQREQQERQENGHGRVFWAPAATDARWKVAGFVHARNEPKASCGVS